LTPDPFNLGDAFVRRTKAALIAPAAKRDTEIGFTQTTVRLLKFSKSWNSLSRSDPISNRTLRAPTRRWRGTISHDAALHARPAL